MPETLLTVPPLCWSPHDPTPSSPASPAEARALTGRFATAQIDGENLVLTRDRLGLGKLFVAHHPQRGPLAANYALDLVHAGIPLAGIAAVPPGIYAVVSCTSTRLERFHTLTASAGASQDPAETLRRAKMHLADGMHQLTRSRPGVPAVVCLSGGADSSLIATTAATAFGQVTAYTYTFDDGTGELSDDAAAAAVVAEHLGIRLRLVTADEDAILNALPGALALGQDWREFNVHAAIVSDLLAHAIASDHRGDPAPIVLTGDLMNELLADYSPVRYDGADHYRLPDLPRDQLRAVLTAGMQAGDREVGVFAAHGLELAQPYGWIAEDLLALPDGPKSPIITALASRDLPPGILTRPKVRAQIGDANARRGILPLLHRTGHGPDRLLRMFAEIYHCTPGEPARFLRAGRYRPLT